MYKKENMCSKLETEIHSVLEDVATLSDLQIETLIKRIIIRIEKEKVEREFKFLKKFFLFLIFVAYALLIGLYFKK
jgi:hypothetical protein